MSNEKATANVNKLDEFRASINEVESHNNEEDFHRNSSTFGAFFNIVCVIAGTGTLGLPYTLAQGGWLSLLFIVLSAAISYYTGALLIDCLYYKPGHRITSYPDVGEAAFGRVGRLFVQTFHYAIMLGASCLFIMLAGINVFALCKSYGYEGISKQLWIVIGGAIILIPYVSFKNMKEVAIMSFFGTLATLVVIVVSVVIGLLDVPNNLDVHHDPVVWSGIPIALASISFTFGGNVVYPHVEGSMKKPKQFKPMLFAAMVTISAMYVLVSAVGYYVYGTGVKSPILESLPFGIANTVATLFITLHVIAAAPILLCGFSFEMENSFNINTDHMSKSKELIIRVAIRVLTTGVLTLIAVFVPFFGDFMSLVGALANCMIVFVIPVVCHLKLLGWRNRTWYEYIWIFIVFVVAFIGCILGAIDAVKALIKDFAQEAAAAHLA